jgi:hypothetical protein
MKHTDPLDAMVKILAAAAVEEFLETKNLLKTEEDPMEINQEGENLHVYPRQPRRNTTAPFRSLNLAFQLTNSATTSKRGSFAIVP